MPAMSQPTTRRARLVPSRWTGPLTVFTAVCSIVFTLGTALHNFAVIDSGVIEEMMRRAGGADPAGDAPGFTTGFRIVGSIYIAGNAVGILALRSRASWLFWTVLTVNATQGLGWVMIPPQMWSVTYDRYGIAGVLPSAVTDGGGAVLALVLLATLVRYRTSWARLRRTADE